MNKLRYIAFRSYQIIFFIIVMIVVLLGLILLNTVSSIIESKNTKEDLILLSKELTINKNEFVIINKTQLLQIISNEIIDKEVHFLLKNNYSKNINGFYATVGDDKENESYNVELIYSEIKTEISPQGTFILRIPLEDKLYKSGLTLQSVVFTDGSSDGENQYISEIKDIRKGEKNQLTKGLNLLNNYLSSPDNLNSNTIVNLIQSVSTFETTDSTKSSNYNSGMFTGKENLLQYLGQIQKNQKIFLQSNKEELLKLRSKLEKYIQKLNGGEKQ
ncbi:MAG TPA: hypothetical protein PKE69_16775 [Pyrinomonadaceae bacterium]|nr:hypothetical protein [Pyrinomonadaceae bacterium]